MDIADPLDEDGVGSFLADAGFEATDVERVGAGAWSSCFGFKDCSRDLVVMFGVHIEDFEKDRYAVRFASPGLLVPALVEVLERLGPRRRNDLARAPPHCAWQYR